MALGGAGGAQVGAFERIDGDVDLVEVAALRRWPCRARPTFSPMKSIGASSRSPSPMTIVPSIGTRVELAAHGLDGRLIRPVAIALAHGVGAGDGGLFDDAQELEGEV